MGLHLRQHVYWCVCDGRIIFLDLLADHYFCLRREAAADFLQVVGCDGKTSDIGPLGGLLARGILVEDQRATTLTRSPPIEPASEDFLDEPYPSAKVGDVLVAVVFQSISACSLRTRGLAKTVATSRRRHACHIAGAPASRDRRLAEILSGFAAASLILPSADRCLVRALALHSICRRNGIRPLLVFGVRMDPFRAHCWVQLAAKVLIGDFEQVRLFTPLVALG